MIALSTAAGTRAQRLTNRVEFRLLILAGIFLFFQALTLSLSPAARLRSLDVPYLWVHWVGYGVWVVGFSLLHLQLNRHLPDRDPYILPIAATLLGWGLLTIWRVAPAFAYRQTLWLALAVLTFLVLLRLPEDLAYLRRYKYLWLTGGLILTAFTLILGTNPNGPGPRLWLGCCGFYFQPSEPLKLLLVVYLAAYLADRQFQVPRLIPLLAPTLLLTGIAIGLMIAQRDLGTASIFLILFVSVVYFTTGKSRFLGIGLIALVVSGLAGYLLYDVIRIRVDAWINPWIDPSGRSYQIVQSLLAIAAGGMLGRGPGLGSPTLVPVQHSDFIFASIAEENGLVGTMAMLILLAGLTVRGLRTGLKAPDNFRRYLAIGLTVYLSAQSILIIGGNLRLLPLTGVTLPFVSYGGSSLFTATLALLFLITISDTGGAEPAPLANPKPTLIIGALLLTGIAGLAIVNGWWGFYRGPALLTRTDNARRSLADRFVPRGSILDRTDTPIATNSGQPGEYVREYLVPALGPVVGYLHPLYGQAGLEDAQDDYLRGLNGNPAIEVWWNHLLYGQPPPGLDVRESLDLALQGVADEELGDHTGALVLMNAESGEILAMASHPSFDPGKLDDEWQTLIERKDAPLLNRAALGQYPAKGAIAPLLLAAAIDLGKLPELSATPDVALLSGCSSPPEMISWTNLVQQGCPFATDALYEALGSAETEDLFSKAGFYQSPNLRLPTTSTPLEPGRGTDLLVSPLQVAIGLTALSGDGHQPAPRIATATRAQDDTWESLPPLSVGNDLFTAQAVLRTRNLLSIDTQPIWETTALSMTDDGGELTWYLAGTNSDWKGAPLSLVLILEENNPEEAQRIGRQLISTAIE